MNESQTYEQRNAAHIAKHVPQLTFEEKVTVAAVREYLKLKLRGNNLILAMSVFDGGVINAIDTCFIEKTNPREEWTRTFILSMEVLLTEKCTLANKRVQEVFRSINIQG